MMATMFPKNLTILLSMMASLSMLVFSFGYEISILFLEATTAMGEELKLTEHEVANFVNDSRWSLIIACALSGYLADLIGRRTTIIISGYVSCLGFMLMASSRSFGMLIAGRVISLAGMGLGLPVTPLYIGEIAPPLHRGFLNSIPEVLSVLGQLFAVVMQVAVGGYSPSQQWRRMIGVGAIPSILLVLGMTFMPESPCWLIMKGRVAETKATLKMTLKTDEEVNQRLSALRSAARVPPTASDEVERVEVPPNAHMLAIWQEVIRPCSLVTTLVKAIISILTLHILQLCTGIDLLTIEAMTKFIFQLPSPHSLEFLTGLIPFLCGRFLPILLPLFLSDIVKRKMILSFSLMLTAIFLTAINISLLGSRDDYLYTMIPTFAVGANRWTMVLFMGSFSVGLGPVTWTHTSEMLPYKVRAQVIGIVVMLNKLMTFGFSYLKPVIDRESNWIINGLLYWVLNILLIIGVAVFEFGRLFIESIGRSLEELDELPHGSTIELT